MTLTRIDWFSAKYSYDSDMSDEWAAEIARRIAAEVRKLRGDNSGQWLSDRTADLGHRVSRSTISELENGKRSSVGVDALIVLAAALDVPVASLLYPGLGDVELLPGKVVTHSEAIKQLAGSAEAVREIQALLDDTAEVIKAKLETIRTLSSQVERLRAEDGPGKRGDD